MVQGHNYVTEPFHPNLVELYLNLWKTEKRLTFLCFCLAATFQRHPMYLHTLVGNAPILLTVPHDGDVKVADAPVRKSLIGRDAGTLALALRLHDRFHDLGLRPTLLWQTLHRTHSDPNRSAKRDGYAKGFQEVHEEFHNIVDAHAERLLALHGKVLHLDIHSCTAPEPWDLFLGTNRHATCPRGTDQILLSTLSAHHSISLSRPYRTIFSPDYERGMDARFSGGWITRRSARAWGERGLDAIQIECNAHMCESPVTNELALHLAETLASLL